MTTKKTNICFVANFFKTFLFHELSKKLAEEGVGIYWIVTKLEQFNFLKEHYPIDQILYVNRAFADIPSTSVDDFRLNELVYGDRVFKFDLQHGLNFLTNIQKPVYDFILNNELKFIFGEITWAHELLIQRMVQKRKELNSMYLECSLVRIPNNRLAFFKDDSQNEMVEFNLPVEVNEIIKLEKPAYLKLNDKIMKQKGSVLARLDRVRRFISGENIEKNDPNVITHKPTRFKVTSKEEYNKITYRRIDTVSFETIEHEKYIFVGFHKQPEASIDVSGRYYEDQALNAINLWRLLPQGWKLVLKEHTNAIGDRTYHFYKNLLSYPNIVMVNETTDSKKLIASAQLVATVTGTIAYEAAMMQVPAITFAKVFFNRINYCRHLTLHDLINYDSLSTLVNDIRSQEDNRLAFSRYLMQNTFDGYISDYVTDPTVMDEKNITKLKSAFMTLLQKGHN